MKRKNSMKTERYESLPWLKRYDKTEWRKEFETNDNFTEIYFTGKIEFSYSFCDSCKHFGSPNGCNRHGGTCQRYNLAENLWDRLYFYEQTGLSSCEISKMIEDTDFLPETVNKLKNENYWLKDKICHLEFEKISLEVKIDSLTEKVIKH